MMSVQLQRTQRLRAEDASFKKSLQLLNSTRSADDARLVLTDLLDSLRRFFDDLTGNECRVALRLTNFYGAGCEQLRDRRFLANLREKNTSLAKVFASANFPAIASTASARTVWCDPMSQDFGNDADPHWTVPFARRVMAPVRAPETMAGRPEEVIGCLTIDIAETQVDDMCERALVAFAYEIYFALSRANRSGEFDYVEELSLK